MKIVDTFAPSPAAITAYADWAHRGFPEYGADGIVRVSMRPFDRRAIGVAIERLIAMLDAMDGDPDLEDGRDDEPSLGWTEAWGGRGYVACRDDDGADREDENEHGGDISDEPHDATDEGDEGDDEPWLGRLETAGQLGSYAGVCPYSQHDVA